LRRRADRVAVTGNREYNPGWHTALDLHPLLTVSEAVTRAALRRRESRGAHFRADYPAKDEALGRERFVVKRDADGGMAVTSIPVPPLPPELARIIEEMK
jgi:succinate dehydrogenase / fumarate reductase flavoprotein subunit